MMMLLTSMQMNLLMIWMNEGCCSRWSWRWRWWMYSWKSSFEGIEWVDCILQWIWDESWSLNDCWSCWSSSFLVNDVRHCVFVISSRVWTVSRTRSPVVVRRSWWISRVYGWPRVCISSKGSTRVWYDGNSVVTSSVTVVSWGWCCSFKYLGYSTRNGGCNNSCRGNDTRCWTSSNSSVGVLSCKLIRFTVDRSS